MTQLLHADLTYKLRGMGFRIYNELGPGHREEDYQEALEWVLRSEGIAFLPQQMFRIDYKNWQIGEYYPDFVFANNALVVDLKATAEIEPLHKAQVLSYLRVTNAELGMIMNFGGLSMQFERLPNFMDNRRTSSGPRQSPEGILYPELTNLIIDALHEVHCVLGPGFLHQIYRRATRRELMIRRVNFDYIKELPLRFEGYEIGRRPTQLYHIEKKLLLATVALHNVTGVHMAKLRWAMKQLGCRLGLIANFHPTQLDIEFIRIG